MLLLITALQIQLALNLMIFLSNFETLWWCKDVTIRLYCHFKWLQCSIKIMWSDDWTAIESTLLDSSSSINGFNRLISEPTHILSNSFSYIDLVFIDQPHLVVDSGVHPTVHENCHHQVTCCNSIFRLNCPPLPLPPPPLPHTHIHTQNPYERLVWDFKRTDVNEITTAINQVDWKFMFS